MMISGGGGCRVRSVHVITLLAHRFERAGARYIDVMFKYMGGGDQISFRSRIDLDCQDNTKKLGRRFFYCTSVQMLFLLQKISHRN
jgi:hypothetical protein